MCEDLFLLSVFLALILVFGLFSNGLVSSRRVTTNERLLYITPRMNARLKEEGKCYTRGETGLLGPDDIHCPMSKEGFVSCCHCLLDFFFYEHAVKAKSSYEARRAHNSRQREPPEIEWDAAKYRAPVEADDLVVFPRDTGTGHWKHISFKCRVTLSDEEYMRYLSHRKYERAASYVSNLPKVTKNFKIYCLPQERLVVRTSPTERQYTLHDADGNVRTTATSGYCEPVQYQGQPGIPEGSFPIRTMMPLLQGKSRENSDVHSEEGPTTNTKSGNARRPSRPNRGRK